MNRAFGARPLDWASGTGEVDGSKILMCCFLLHFSIPLSVLGCGIVFVSSWHLRYHVSVEALPPSLGPDSRTFSEVRSWALANDSGVLMDKWGTSSFHKPARISQSHLAGMQGEESMRSTLSHTEKTNNQPSRSAVTSPRQREPLAELLTHKPESHSEPRMLLEGLPSFSEITVVEAHKGWR